MHGDQPNRAEAATANVRAARDALLERLNSDLRVLSPIGIERVAWGWDRHEPNSAETLHAAERAAIRAIEGSQVVQEWDEWRRRLFQEVEGQLAFTAWRAEHGTHSPHVHKAERAAFAAALGLFARPWISRANYSTLVSAMAEALPWLLPERPPAPAT